MSSLRGSITIWLWATIASVGLISTTVAILQARRETQAQVDYQLQQVAQIVADQLGAVRAVSGGPEPQLIPSIHVRHDKDDDLIVAVRDPQGRALYASRTNRHLAARILPELDTLGFQTLTLGHDGFRVFSSRSADGLHIEVAQSVDVTSEAVRNMAIATLAPIALLLPLLAVVLGWAIRRQLKPLEGLRATVAARAPLSLELLPTHDVPREVSPLIQEFNRLLRRLTTAVEREQRFVTDAAHALRTPLTALQLQAEVLEGGTSQQERTSRLSDLRSGIRRLIRLSEQLLAHARSQLDTGPITSTTPLDPILKEIVGFYAQSAQARNVTLALEVDSSAQVYGNARRLTLIVGNLIDNSLRFSPAGGRIRVRALPVTQGVRVEVWDQGPGVPPHELERVFERFYQGSDHEGSGSGLGLATVQALVQQLGGSVHLENRVDRAGLVAIVTLPVVPMPSDTATGQDVEAELAAP